MKIKNVHPISLQMGYIGNLLRMKSWVFGEHAMLLPWLFSLLGEFSKQFSSAKNDFLSFGHDSCISFLF